MSRFTQESFKDCLIKTTGSKFTHTSNLDRFRDKDKNEYFKETQQMFLKWIYLLLKTLHFLAPRHSTE